MFRPIMRVFVLMVASGFACAALAQSYPAKPIRIIIPFPPGNTMDIIARLIGPKITERLGQSVIIDNRAGASGQLGLELGARGAPDVKEPLVSAGLIVVTESPEYFAATIKSDYAKYGKLIRDIGFQPQ